MAEKIDFENGRNSKFEGLVTLSLTFDPAIRHTVVHHSSTSTYIPNFIQIEETFCGRTDVRTDVRTDGRTYGRADGHFSPLLYYTTKHEGGRHIDFRQISISLRQTTANNCKTAFSLHVVESASDDYSF